MNNLFGDLKTSYDRLTLEEKQRGDTRAKYMLMAVFSLLFILSLYVFGIIHLAI